MSDNAIIFKQPDEKEFEQVKELVKDFWLDNENMQPEPFSILLYKGKLIAFARLKEKDDAIELGTLGVVKDFRRKGWGSKMVQYLLEKASCDVYVVTTMFEFNAKLGFVITEQYPDSIKRKIEICVKDYHVGEPYFVMKYEKK